MHAEIYFTNACIIKTAQKQQKYRNDLLFAIALNTIRAILTCIRFK